VSNCENNTLFSILSLLMFSPRAHSLLMATIHHLLRLQPALFMLMIDNLRKTLLLLRLRSMLRRNGCSLVWKWCVPPLPLRPCWRIRSFWTLLNGYNLFALMQQSAW